MTPLSIDWADWNARCWAWRWFCRLALFASGVVVLAIGAVLVLRAEIRRVVRRIAA